MEKEKQEKAEQKKSKGTKRKAFDIQGAIDKLLPEFEDIGIKCFDRCMKSIQETEAVIETCEKAPSSKHRLLQLSTR